MPVTAADAKLALDVHGREELGADDAAPEARREALERIDEERGEPLALSVPAAAQLIGDVLHDRREHVPARWCERGVVLRRQRDLERGRA